MKNTLTKSLAVSFLLLAISITPLFAEEKVITLSSEAVSNLNLKFSPVAKRLIKRTVQASGSTLLNENRVVEVVPGIAGLVAEVKLDIGAKVKRGDTLFRLSSAELSEAITAYVDAENSMTFSLAAYQQEKTLAEKNLSSKEQVREKELAFKQAVSAHTHALQPLQLLHFDEATIHVYLNNAQSGDYTALDVKAPGSGEVIKRNLRRGASVEPDKSLFTIADLSDLWVDFFVSLREIEGLTVGAKALVSSTVTDQNGEAVISYIAPLANEQSRTVQVRAILKNTDQLWRPGTPVVVSVNVSSNEKVLTVPSGAIVERAGENVVFVRQKDGGFSPVIVKVGESDGANIAIIGGVTDGQTVVSKNAAQLKGHLEMTASE